MIKRESYLSQIRPFIDKSGLIKVIVGVRRSGKSIMLELIKEELLDKNVPQDQMISINFEDMNYSSLTTAAFIQLFCLPVLHNIFLAIEDALEISFCSGVRLPGNNQ